MAVFQLLLVPFPPFQWEMGHKAKQFQHENLLYLKKCIL